MFVTHITCIEGYDPQKKFYIYISGLKYFYLKKKNILLSRDPYQIYKQHTTYLVQLSNGYKIKCNRTHINTKNFITVLDKLDFIQFKNAY